MLQPCSWCCHFGKYFRSHRHDSDLMVWSPRPALRCAFFFDMLVSRRCFGRKRFRASVASSSVRWQTQEPRGEVRDRTFSKNGFGPVRRVPTSPTSSRTTTESGAASALRSFAILRDHRRLFVLAGCEPVKYSVEEAGRATVTISSGDTVPARLVDEIPPPIEASAKVR